MLGPSYGAVDDYIFKIIRYPCFVKIGTLSRKLKAAKHF